MLDKQWQCDGRGGNLGLDLSIKQSVVFPPSPNPSRSPFLRKHTGLHCPPFPSRCRYASVPYNAAQRRDAFDNFGKIAEIWREEGWLDWQGGQRGRSTRLFVCPAAWTAAAPAGEARELPQSATAPLCNCSVAASLCNFCSTV